MRRLTLALMCAACLLAAGCDEQRGAGGEGNGGGAPPTSAPTERLTPAELDTLQTLIEQTASNDKVLVLDFWATWCGPCKAMFDTIHNGVKSIPNARAASVSVDGPSDKAEAARYLQQHKALEDAYILDPDPQVQSAVVDQLGRRWRNVTVPAILIFDKQGNLATEYVGATGDPKQTAEKIVGKALDLASRPAGGGFEPAQTRPDQQAINEIEKNARQAVEAGRANVPVQDSGNGQNGGTDNQPGL